jgi:putative transposase
MRYEFIQKYREAFPVTLLCKVLEVGKSGFYAWLSREQSPRVEANQRLLIEIRAIHQESREACGSPCVFSALKKKGISCGKHRVAGLMRKHNIRSVHKRKYKMTTDSNHRYPVLENILDRQFEVSKPNACWVSDITYIPTREGWLYLSVVLDLFNREVVGWSMGSRMTRQLVVDTLAMAIDNRSPEDGLLHHSDRGSQYASVELQEILADQNISCSMSRKENCYDNAVAESFFHTLKVECVHRKIYETRKQAKSDLFEYIEVFYNRKRLHSYLGYRGPVEFRELQNAA